MDLFAAARNKQTNKCHGFATRTSDLVLPGVNYRGNKSNRFSRPHFTTHSLVSFEKSEIVLSSLSSRPEKYCRTEMVQVRLCHGQRRNYSSSCKSAASPLSSSLHSTVGTIVILHPAAASTTVRQSSWSLIEEAYLKTQLPASSIVLFVCPE